ncbi:EAL domain-containing protein [Altericista sp. CCNU0014]|uniref:two-component system response regulator n=1 Tax=Altericista sp. CCNU0014 TaxID=3082949 RepID=UPI003850AA16
MNNFKGKILLVDDRVENLELLFSILTKAGYEVRRAINGSSALMGVKSVHPDLILLDINMPDMNGYEVCRQLKKDSQHQDIPVIFISALDDGLDKMKAFSAGGVDYITKPFEMMEVLSRIENHMQIKAARTKLKDLNIELEKRVAERTLELTAATQALEQENIERRKAQAMLEHMAWHDPLTDLPNRTWLMQQLQDSIAKAKQETNYQFAVLFLDCDRFKVINDSLGHMVGDRLLVEIAHRLMNSLPSNATLARFGGDEFIVILKAIERVDDAQQLAQKLQSALASPFNIELHEMFVSASIGIVLGNFEVRHPEDLVRNADIAMYRAKALGKARYYVFNTDLYNNAQKRLQLETDLRRAIERKEFFLQYQPIVSLKSGEIEGFEALVRWNHPKRGLISPIDFVPVAEETGLIVPLGYWILEEACRQFQDLKTDLETTATSEVSQKSLSLKISVNLSAKQFSQPGLIDTIDEIFEKTDFDSKNLNLEITESVLMDDPQSNNIILKALKDRHIQLTIDDFGTGYSSLSYLHRFSVDALKIDRSFICRLAPSGDGLRIVEAMTSMAQSLGIMVVAEGVETSEQILQLQQLGCDYAQGYWFAKPLDSEAAKQLLLSCQTFNI